MVSDIFESPELSSAASQPTIGLRNSNLHLTPSVKPALQNAAVCEKKICVKGPFVAEIGRLERTHESGRREGLRKEVT